MPLAIGERLVSHGHPAQAVGAEHLESAIHLAGQAAAAVQMADLCNQLHEDTVDISCRRSARWSRAMTSTPAAMSRRSRG